jgi:heme/copper-type cytochrome/quinol oxidase subunit 2
MLYLWWRMDEEGRFLRAWSLYGRFCGLMVCGSCFGVVTWTARMMSLANFFISRDALSRGDRVQQASLVALAENWSAVFHVMYAIDFLCLSAARLMVLDRMSYFAAGHDDDSRKLWAAGGRMVMAFVVLGNSVGLVGNIAATVHIQKSVEAASAASALFAANSTRAAEESFSRSLTEVQLATSISAVQLFSEVAVLLLIVAAFVVTGVACARVFRSRLLAVDAASASAETGRELRWQMVVTTAVVFVAFVVRSVLSTMFAIARQLQNRANQCPGVTSLCDSTCYNVFTHIFWWMARTPEFQVTIVLVSSPLTLLVALWGMTSRQTLHAMKSKEQEVPLRQRVLSWGR